MEKKMSMPKIEQERLFGAGVDLFKSYYATKFLHNVLKNIGLLFSVWNVSAFYIPRPQNGVHKYAADQNNTNMCDRTRDDRGRL